jgi:hypothetical protein
MKTENFLHLINSITNRDFMINTKDIDVVLEKEYTIYRILPITEVTIKFYFKTPKKEESIIKAFITQYSSKYLEPNPSNYTGIYPGSKDWNNMNEKEREFAYYHHRSNMFSKNNLIQQIEENINTSKVDSVLSRYGFYETHYGIGLFVIFNRESPIAVNKMRVFLKAENIPYSNEFSDAQWVYRFVINISKNLHKELLDKFDLLID